MLVKWRESLKAPIAIIDKRRPSPNVLEGMNIIGNIEGETAILIDDIIDQLVQLRLLPTH